MRQIQVCNPLHLIPLPDNMAVRCLVATFQKVFRWLPPYLKSFDSSEKRRTSFLEQLSEHIWTVDILNTFAVIYFKTLSYLES